MSKRRKPNTGRPKKPATTQSSNGSGGGPKKSGSSRVDRTGNSQSDSQRQWYKVDLHLHTMASHDYEQPEASYLEWMRRAAEQELDIVAITDHNTVSGIGAIREEIEWLTRLEQQNRLTDDESQRLEEWRQLSEKVLVLPGFEFTATFGFHILGIFPADTSVRHLEHTLLTLNVPADKLDEGTTKTGATADVLTAYRVIREAGGIAIAAHANGTHGVAMRDFPFGGQMKIAYTQDPNLDALEVTDLEKRGRSTARFFNGSKAEYPRRMHCIQGSDAHRLGVDPKRPKRLGIGERATELLLEAPTFQAIQSLFQSNQFNRTRPVRPKDQPFDAIAAAREEGPTISQSFHESASQRGGRLTAILSDLCAMANAVGGTVYIGANHRKSKPKGLVDPKQTQDEILSALTERMTPPLDIKCEVAQSEGSQILCLTVPKGEERPYCLDEYKFYIRDDSETSLAVRDEIVALVSEMLNTQHGRSNKDGKKTKKENGSKKSRRGGKSTQHDQGRTPKESGQSEVAPLREVAKEEDAFYLPQVGVEIIDSVQRNGNQSYSICDMRNGHVIKNVTRKGSRKLWNYAIQQHEDHPVDPKKIDWNEDIALVRMDKRAGKIRYDLALREQRDVRVFYGVTEDGMEGRWATFIEDSESNSK